MTRNEAKKILALHRPGMANETDPRMAEALELVQRDPELAAWFEQQKEVFDVIRAKLKAVPVPQGLRRQIIVEHAANTRILPLANRLLLVAAVAALVLLTGIICLKFAPNDETSFDSYRNRMTSMVQRSYLMMNEKDQAKIRDYFGSKGAPTDYVVPKKLEKLPGEGGVVFTWNSHQVSLLCLDGATQPGDKNDLYLFMVNRSVLPSAPAPGKKPEFKNVSHLMTMTWTVGDKVYLLAGKGDEATLQKYLE